MTATPSLRSVAVVAVLLAALLLLALAHGAGTAQGPRANGVGGVPAAPTATANPTPADVTWGG